MHESEYSVAVLITDKNGGVPLIRDPKKPAPVYWKLPGGRSEEGETAEQCAARELREETGLVIKPKDLVQIYEENRGSHMLVIFKAQVKDFSMLNEFGNEGEEIQIFTPKIILGMADFFPNHKRIVAGELLKLSK
ncbi:MAG TPA: NUDIX hydrolase [Candidatus Paceibacterota bacterium]|nr:NUDIX hydrolase [Candidatus Paceibacterota bacterium]